MNRNLRRRSGPIAVAAAAVVLAPAAAQAAVVRLDDWAFGNSWSHVVSVGSPVHHGAAGGFRGWVDFSPGEEAQGWSDVAAGRFVTYCVEITESFHGFPSASMADYGVVPAATYGWSAERAQRIGRLMSHVAAEPSSVDTAAESTALQLALWNLVYDTDADRSLHAGAFRAASPSPFDDGADQLLAAAENTANRFEVFVLSKRGSQDFLLLREVPEPATLALSLAALGGLGLGRGRRRGGAGTGPAAR